MDVEPDIGGVGTRLHREKQDRVEGIAAWSHVAEEMFVALAIVAEQSAQGAGAGVILEREGGSGLESERQAINSSLERMDYSAIVGDSPQPVEPRNVSARHRLLTHTQHKVGGTVSTHNSYLKKKGRYIHVWYVH